MTEMIFLNWHTGSRFFYWITVCMLLINWTIIIIDTLFAALGVLIDSFDCYPDYACSGSKSVVLLVSFGQCRS